MKKMTKKDRLYSQKVNIADFSFGKETAIVFDDMLMRSVPLYSELQRMISEIANEFSITGTDVYDLGCSTGVTLQNLHQGIQKKVRFVGVDYSQAMLDLCRKNVSQLKDPRKCEFICADLNQAIKLRNASVVVLNLTLQFVRPLCRDRLIQSIYAGLRKNGCIICIEKVLGNDTLFNRTFIQFYYDMKKRNGYTEMEIAQKREALENVLIPYRVDENIALLQKNRFQKVDIFYKWYNFCGFLGIKCED